MKKFFSVIIAVTAICLLALACDKGNTEPSTPQSEHEGEKEEENEENEEEKEEKGTARTTTGSVTDISFFHVTLSGTFNFDGLDPSDYYMGFIYSDKSGKDYWFAEKSYLDPKGGEFSKVIIGLKNNCKYYYRSYILNTNNSKCVYGAEESFTTKDTIVVFDGPVDLGTSVLWDSKNIGANEPYEAGTFFAWGDIKGQTWNGTKWSGDGFSESASFKLDATTGELKPECDAAREILKGNWRMPTRSEQAQLSENCACIWVENYNGTGVKGFAFQSKEEGCADVCMFLPASGRGYLTDYDYSFNALWSSSSKPDERNSQIIKGVGISINEKYETPGVLLTSPKVGFPIRAVCDKPAE